MVQFKHNKTDALLGWFHTIGEQCIIVMDSCRIFILILWYCFTGIACRSVIEWTLGLYSLSGETSYCNISWSLETTRSGFSTRFGLRSIIIQYSHKWSIAQTWCALTSVDCVKVLGVQLDGKLNVDHHICIMFACFAQDTCLKQDWKAYLWRLSNEAIWHFYATKFLIL